MCKKILLTSVFILAIIFMGDILYLFTHSGLLANWGSIMIPSFVVGILWRLMTKDNLKTPFRFTIPLMLGFIKLVIFLMTAKEPTLLAAIFIPIIYSAVSYLFFILGLKTVPDQDTSNKQEQNISQ